MVASRQNQINQKIMGIDELIKLTDASDPKYSWHLSKWLKKFRNRFAGDRLVIGSSDDDDGHVYHTFIGRRETGRCFIGRRLVPIIFNHRGSKTEIVSYVWAPADNPVVENKELLERYIAHGICGIDTAHNWDFIPGQKDSIGRWQVSANRKQRTCVFCGLVQKLVKTRQVRTIEHYETTTAPSWLLSE
jgi:hypothetical protein